MKELFFILLVTSSYSLLCLYPIFFKNSLILKKLNLSTQDLIILNILLLCNSLLILCLLNLKISSAIIIIQFFYVFLIFLIFRVIKIDQTLKKFLPYFLFTFLGLIIAIDIANNLTLYWDAKKLWLPKTLIFFNDLDLSELQNTGYPHYSFFGSIIWSFFWKLSHMEEEYFGRIFFAIIFCLSIFSFSRLFGDNFIKKNFVFLFIVILIYDYWHFRGTQEILNFSFLLICSIYFYEIIYKKKQLLSKLFIIFLGINLLIWTKNEGIIISTIVIFLLTIFMKKKLFFKTTLLLVFAIMVFLRFKIYNYYGINVSLSEDFDFKNLFTIFFSNLNFNNIEIILKYLAISSLKFPHIALSFICGFIILFDKKLFFKSLFIYLYLVLSLSTIIFIYLSSPQNIEFMVSTGLMRIFFEMSSPYLLFILVLFENKIETVKISN
ncbi:hypothetical protein IDH30_00075 [Pelagibacterales bacterium SAG-MED15]|nr:hypothetical protein [Pelagibacterales bacterium SAG-MED15]